MNTTMNTPYYAIVDSRNVLDCITELIETNADLDELINEVLDIYWEEGEPWTGLIFKILDGAPMDLVATIHTLNYQPNVNSGVVRVTKFSPINIHATQRVYRVSYVRDEITKRLSTKLEELAEYSQ